MEPLHKIEKGGFSYTASHGLLFNKFWEFSKQYETFVTYVSHLLKKKKLNKSLTYHINAVAGWRSNWQD